MNKYNKSPQKTRSNEAYCDEENLISQQLNQQYQSREQKAVCMITDLFHCQCHMCFKHGQRIYQQADIKEDPFFKKALQLQKQMPKIPHYIPGINHRLNPELYDRDLNFILKRIQPKIPSISLKVPFNDIIIFSCGEPKVYMFNQKNNFVRTNKTKLKNTEIRQTMTDRRKNRDQEFILDLEQAYNQTQYAKNNEDEVVIDTKLSNLMLGLDMKHLKATNFKSIDLKMACKEFAVIRFTDDQIVIYSELEFFHLMNKIRRDKIWTEIMYIQSFIAPLKGLKKFIKVKFQLEEHKQNSLYIKAKNEVIQLQIYTQQWTPEDLHNYEDSLFTIELDEYENQLLNKNINNLAFYYVARIVNWIEIFHNIQIEQMLAEFTKDDYGNLQLTNCSHIQHFDTSGLKKNDEIFKQKMIQMTLQENAIYFKNMDIYVDQLTLDKKEIIHSFTDSLIQDYNNQKQQAGITLPQEIAYKKQNGLHPEKSSIRQQLVEQIHTKLIDQNQIQNKKIRPVSAKSRIHYKPQDTFGNTQTQFQKKEKVLQEKNTMVETDTIHVRQNQIKQSDNRSKSYGRARGVYKIQYLLDDRQYKQVSPNKTVSKFNKSNKSALNEYVFAQSQTSQNSQYKSMKQKLQTLPYLLEAFPK